MLRIYLGAHVGEKKGVGGPEPAQGGGSYDTQALVYTCAKIKYTYTVLL